MTEQLSEPTVRPLSLPARIVGVIFSPGATYRAIAARPAILGVLVVVILLNGGITYWMLGSEAGQQAMLTQVEEGLRQQEAQGQTISPQQREFMTSYVRYFGMAVGIAQVVFTPVFIALIAGIAMGVLNAVLGEQRSFRHLYSVVTHSTIITGIAGLFTTPIMLAKEELSSPARLSVLLPMLPEDTFLTHLLGAIDFVWIWWLINLSIGLAVLYKRKTAPFATTLLSVYGVVALAIATVRSIF